jgi:hypothetical protein
MIDQKYLKECLSYDPETGVFTWMPDRPESHFRSKRDQNSWRTQFAGSKAGGMDNMGYICMWVGRKSQRAHRLAWLYIHGRLPSGQIDHINGQRADNRIANLREANHQENGRNQKRPKSNTSGHTGVCWNPRNNNWFAQIAISGENKYLGSFKFLEEAITARKHAEKRYGFHENHGRDERI